ncbi:MAG: hypothetical protein ABI683_01010 [Ginsengibacter sp.]
MKKETFVIQTIGTDLHSKQMILEGQLAIGNAAIIKKELTSALNDSQNLELILRNVVKADMAFLQLLISLKKSALAENKHVAINIDDSESINLAITNSGLSGNFFNNKKY